MRLFCFPFAGGTASSFFDWRKRCNSLEVCPIEYPGRGSRWKENAYATLEMLVEGIATDLGSELHQPYALLGHSFGAIVAFEVTRLLHRWDSPLPVRLCISAVRAPHLPHREMIHSLPEQEFLSRLISYGGVPPEVLGNQELLALLMPIVRDDFRLYEQYKYKAGDPLPVPISVFGGQHDLKVPAADLLAWRQHTTKSFRCRFYSGTHFFLYDPHLPVIKDVQNDIHTSAVPAFLPGVE
jgi:medium-chain acyl-[acyl-carrier-protein] hydrolase